MLVPWKIYTYRYFTLDLRIGLTIEFVIRPFVFRENFSCSQRYQDSLNLKGKPAHLKTKICGYSWKKPLRGAPNSTLVFSTDAQLRLAQFTQLAQLDPILGVYESKNSPIFHFFIILCHKASILNFRILRTRLKYLTLQVFHYSDFHTTIRHAFLRYFLSPVCFLYGTEVPWKNLKTMILCRTFYADCTTPTGEKAAHQKCVLV